VHVGSVTIGRGILEPGFPWSTSLRPIQGTPSCQIHGVHTGEVEVLPNDIGGVAVHAAARIMALGGASEIIVSSVTRGLVEGSGFRFSERGHHQVKGLERPIEVFLLET
jgi:class 3 adenylate cyclase